MLLKTNKGFSCPGRFVSGSLVRSLASPGRTKGGFLTTNGEWRRFNRLYEFLTLFLCLPYQQSHNLDLDGCVARRDERIGARRDVRAMLDLFYILIGVLFFVGCVAFVRACDRL